MIELNLSYEQSKKILELGYDFTPICRDFELHEEEKITKFVLVKRSDDGVVTLYDCSEHESYIYSTKSWWITPIIPKAALEACLPESFPDAKLGRDYKLQIENKIPEYFYRANTPFGNVKNIIRSDSAFETFLWCHENYQEELKNKFEEVLK